MGNAKQWSGRLGSIAAPQGRRCSAASSLCLQNITPFCNNLNKFIVPFIKCKYKSSHCNTLCWSGDVRSFTGDLQPARLHQLHQEAEGQTWELLLELLSISSAAGFAAWVLVGGLGAIHSSLLSM